MQRQTVIKITEGAEITHGKCRGRREAGLHFKVGGGGDWERAAMDGRKPRGRGARESQRRRHFNKGMLNVAHIK